MWPTKVQDSCHLAVPGQVPGLPHKEGTWVDGGGELKCLDRVSKTGSTGKLYKELEPALLRQIAFSLFPRSGFFPFVFLALLNLLQPVWVGVVPVVSVRCEQGSH